MLLEAEDRAQAYRKVIAYRAASNDVPKASERERILEAQLAFRRSDRLIELEGTLEDAPYQGSLEDLELFR